MVLAKRIIPCLDVDNGRVVKGVHFAEVKDAGDPVELAKRYSEQGADELVFLDITASQQGRDTMKGVVRKVASVIDIPFTVGGGIKKLEDGRDILLSGADKVSINTAAVKNPELVTQLMSTVHSRVGRTWTSSKLRLTGWRTSPSMVNDQVARSTRGVGPADRTGKSRVRYWPGGVRLASSPPGACRRPTKPRDTKPSVTLAL